jgi:hypothetical protein
MVKKREVIRKYHFPDSWLTTLCNRTILFMIRDILKFSAYAVDAAVVDAYRDEVDEFEVYPTDIELAGKQKIKTEEKDTAADLTKTGIRGVMTRVVLKFKEGTPKYEMFGTKGMDAMTDSELLKCGRRVVRMGTEYLAELAGTGLTALILTALDDQCQTFEDAIGAQEDAISKRDIATQERSLLGNAIFEKLMNYCSIGQNIWYDNDEAKYNDYVIYTKSGSLVHPIEMTIEFGETKNIINKLFAGDAVFEIINTGGAKLSFGFCLDGTTPVSSGVDVAAGESKTVTAAELGDFAANQYLNCTNNEPAAGSFKIKLP